VTKEESCSKVIEKSLWDDKTGWIMLCCRMMEILLHGNDVINTVIIFANLKSDLYQVRFKLRRSYHAKCCGNAV
jgi:hypothetical protein